MNVSELWKAMEDEAGRAPNQAWLMRLALPLPGCQLVAGFHVPSRSPAALLQLAGSAELPARLLPECAGLEVRVANLGSRSYLTVRLKDRGCADVFQVLIEDVVHRIARASGPRTALDELLGRLARWQYFLQVSREGMSLEARRGLWGELYVLIRRLIPAMGVGIAVEGWKAPGDSHQDYQFASGAIEVKTTIAKQPQSVRITSERQLDDTGVGALLLWVVVLDEREVPDAEDVEGDTLPALIRAARNAVAGDIAAARTLELGLFERGWMDAHEERYQDRRWAVRREEVFEVVEGFPRITEAILASGVGSVTYALALAACERFAAPPHRQAELLAILGSNAGEGTSR